VDTNVLVYRWLPSQYVRNVERLLKSDPEWVAPVLWRSEFRNVLAQYFKRKMLPFDIVMEILEKAEDAMTNHEFDVLRFR